MKRVNTQGIIFNDIFINNKQIFINFFETYYTRNQQPIDKAINDLNTILQSFESKTLTANENQAIQFQTAWKNFEQIVLLNRKDLELMVIYRGTTKHQAEFSQIIPQHAVEESVNDVYGINAGNNLIKESMSAIKGAKIEAFLQEHVNGFLHQLELPITKQETEKLFKYHHQFLHNRYLQHQESLTGTKWREAFYTKSASAYFKYGRGLGQAYDAFMNHLANYNKQIYSYLRTNGQSQPTILNIKDPHPSVYKEEKGVDAHGHFPKLLNDSKNHLGWYTGGDIVIIDPQTLSIVYNIQLKTTNRNNPSVFKERVEAIRKFIFDLQKSSPREKGEKIFNFFITSVSNEKEFQQILQSDIDSLIKETLKTQINITLP